MSENAYRPRNRQFDERPITRVQNNFMSGMFNDLPASNIPDNGVAYIKNFINKGDRLEGRQGSHVWGDYENRIPCAELPFEDYTYSNLIDDDGNREIYLTGTTGQVLTPDDVGSFFWINIPYSASGLYEEIINIHQYEGETVFTTSTIYGVEDDLVPGVPNYYAGKLRKKLNGLYFHKSKKVFVLHLGTKLYVSDVNISEWTEVHCASFDSIGNTPSSIDEYNDNVVIWNDSGVYRLDVSGISQLPLFYDKVNLDIPLAINKVINGNDFIQRTRPNYTTNQLVRRYLYTYSKYSDYTSNKTTGNPLIESASNLFDDSHLDYFDAGREVAEGDLLKDNFNPDLEANLGVDFVACLPVKDNSGKYVIDTQFNNFSVYSTANVSADSQDIVKGEGNNTERYAWITDLPAAVPMKMVLSEYLFSSPGAVNRFVFTITQGPHVKKDLTNSPLDPKFFLDGSFKRGNTPITINSVDVLANTITVDRQDFRDRGYDEGYLPPIGTVVMASVGFFNAVSVSSINEGVITITEEEFDPDFFYNGHALFLSDGTTVHVKSVISPTEAEIHETDVTATDLVAGLPLYHNRVKDYAPLAKEDLSLDRTIYWNHRRFYDTLTENQVKSQIAGWPLYSRFYSPLSNANIGKVTSGFGFSAIENSNTVEYSSIPFGYEYLFGYFHPAYQILKISDNIVGIGEVPDRLVVFGRNSTHIAPLNVFQERSLAEIGVVIPILSGQTQVDSNIGGYSRTCFRESEKGKLVVITNEPAIRLFDGNKYSSSLSGTRIGKILKHIRGGVNTVYSTLTGFVFWFKDSR